MGLNFKEWLEAKQAAVVHPEVKKWIDSADKLKQTVEKLKAVLKDKEDKAKHAKPVKVEPVKEKPDIKKKPDAKDVKEKPDIKEKPDMDKRLPDKRLPEKKPVDIGLRRVEKPDVKIGPKKNIEKPTKVEKKDDKGLRKNERPE